jgi:hypothetical protein
MAYQVTRRSKHAINSGQERQGDGLGLLVARLGAERHHRRGGPIEIIHPGDRVLFEADEEHWHGAAPNRLMVHLAINEADAGHDVVQWLDPVADDEYAAAPAVD